jgi:hypothetical protein
MGGVRNAPSLPRPGLTRARSFEVESTSRSRSSVEHDLFGKPVSTFPDHALARIHETGTRRWVSRARNSQRPPPGRSRALALKGKPSVRLIMTTWAPALRLGEMSNNISLNSRPRAQSSRRRLQTRVIAPDGWRVELRHHQLARLIILPPAKAARRGGKSRCGRCF